MPFIEEPITLVMARPRPDPDSKPGKCKQSAGISHSVHFTGTRKAPPDAGPIACFAFSALCRVLHMARTLGLAEIKAYYALYGV